MNQNSEKNLKSLIIAQELPTDVPINIWQLKIFFFKVYPVIWPIPQKTSKINLTEGEKLFSSLFNENGRNSKNEFGQWKYLRNWAFYAFRPFFKFQRFPLYAAFLCDFKDLFSTPKLEGEKAEFDIFELPDSTATSKPSIWLSFVLPTL